MTKGFRLLCGRPRFFWGYLLLYDLLIERQPLDSRCIKGLLKSFPHAVWMSKMASLAFLVLMPFEERALLRTRYCTLWSLQTST